MDFSGLRNTHGDVFEISGLNLRTFRMAAELRSEFVHAMLLGSFALACLWFYHKYSNNLTTINVPIIEGKDGPRGKDFCSAIADATSRYPRQIFKLNTSNYETIVLPARYIPELKSMPEHQLSLGMELYERQLGRYTMIGTVGRHIGFVNSVREDLNHNLSAFIPTLLAEVDYACENTIGRPSDWCPVVVYPQALRMVAFLTGRAFVGLPLSRNEEWVSCSIQTTVDTFTAAFKLWTSHWTIRPFRAMIMPEIRNVHRQNEKAATLIRDTLSMRTLPANVHDPEPSVDMIGFFLKNLPGSDDASYQGVLQSAMNVASIHTTSMAITHVLYDLAAYPTHVGPLREEIDQVLAEHDGILTKNALTKLRKMDSFLRESQRVNPPGIVSMSRKVQSDITLSDGTRLPKGCLVACDSWSATRDPNLWEHPDSFDGFRFARLRATPGNETKYQFVSTSPDNMPFGHGSHACPGRFFVANELKILLAHLVRTYDVSLRPGCQRPQNSFNNIMILPDMGAELMFRTRTDFA